MTYIDFQGLKLSSLGFGAMRLPQLEDGSVDFFHLNILQKLSPYRMQIHHPNQYTQP